jgi:exopolysaccharide production protein ExoZ
LLDISASFAGLGATDPSTTNVTGEARNFRLQYLRAIAAFCVVVFHAAYYLGSLRGDPRAISAIPEILGGFGVYLFFAISGSLMAVLAQRTTADKFICHRIIRIYPLYWLLLSVFLLLSFCFGEAYKFDPLAFALVPGNERGYLLGVEWTLPFELSFYLVIFLVILLRLRWALNAIAAIWALGIVANICLHPDPEQYQFPRLAGLLFSQWTLPFVFGLLVPLAIGKGLIGRWTLPTGALLLAAMWAAPIGGQLILSSACFCFVGWATSPRMLLAEVDRLPLLTRFGDWSYALYLCHAPIITWVILSAPPYVSSAALFFAAIVISLLLASFFGRVDLMLYRTLKILTDSSSSRLRYSSGFAFAAMMLVCGVYTEIAAASDRAMLAFAADLGSRLEDGDQLGPGIAQKLEILGLRADPALLGAIDHVGDDSDGVARVTGWALDSLRSRGQVAVVLFGDGKYLGSGVTGLERPDVDLVVGRYSIISRPGFRFEIRANPSCRLNAMPVVLVASLDKRFAILPAPIGSTACPQSN